MSIKVMTLLWEKSRNKRTALLLLLAIADHAHDDGKGAYPGIDTLAKKTRQTRRNVQLLLKELVDSKELVIHEGEGPHGCNLYEINLKLLRSFEDWMPADGTDVQDENFSPPPPARNFTGENSRVENAPNFTGGVKNSANSDSETSENKPENASAAREISPKPLTVSTNRTDEPVSPEKPIPKAADIWNATLCELQLQMTRATFDAWVKPTQAIEYDVGSACLKVKVRNTYAKEWLDNRLYEMIARVVNHVLDRPTRIIFVLEGQIA